MSENPSPVVVVDAVSYAGASVHVFFFGMKTGGSTVQTISAAPLTFEQNTSTTPRRRHAWPHGHPRTSS